MSAPPIKLDQWYCQIAGKVHGPLSTPDLKRLVREGRLLPTDGVRKGQEGKWIAAQDVKNLFGSRNQAADEVNDVPNASAGTNRVALFAACGIVGVLLLVSLVCVIIAANRGAAPASKPPGPPADPFVRVDPDPFAKKDLDPRPRRPDGALDQFGNPQNRDAGLAQDGEFIGKKILVYGSIGFEDPFLYNDPNPLWVSLKQKGFEVKLLGGRVFPAHLIDSYDQLWIFSGEHRTLTPTDCDAIERFVRAGKGLYLLTDNHPYFADANEITTRMFNVRLNGNYHGTKIAYVNERGMGPDLISKFGGQFPVKDHVLLTGVNFIYEGITVSNFNESPTLKVVMHASDGNPLIGVADAKGWRVVVDCGFTRYFYDQGNPKGPMSFITRVAGTQRFGENVAAYLSGKDR